MAVFSFASLATQLLASLVIKAVAYAIMPRPKTDQDEATKDWPNPTAEGGRPIPVVLGGDITISSPNVLWFGEKRTKMLDA